MSDRMFQGVHEQDAVAATDKRLVINSILLPFLPTEFDGALTLPILCQHELTVLHILHYTLFNPKCMIVSCGPWHFDTHSMTLSSLSIQTPTLCIISTTLVQLTYDPTLLICLCHICMCIYVYMYISDRVCTVTLLNLVVTIINTKCVNPKCLFSFFMHVLLLLSLLLYNGYHRCSCSGCSCCHDMW
jgi:hypothetical protein